MRDLLNKSVGIACLSTLLQVGSMQPEVNAQSLTLDQSANLHNTTANTANPSITRESLLSDVSDKAKAGAAKAESLLEPVGPAPKVGIKNPIVDLKVIARESKLESRGFEYPTEIGSPLNFRATAYALNGRTRSGVHVRRGVIAADPRVLPLGSVVQIKAGNWSGVYTVHDTGGRIKGNIIDVWVPTNHEARQFGRRAVKVHVLRFGNRGRAEK